MDSNELSKPYKNLSIISIFLVERGLGGRVGERNIQTNTILPITQKTAIIE